ncbi:hypothetical protein HPB51_006758 [Rhipicephalus microplus]|uniref:Uncharacterized protein n=1 Tax=Rhipicephalus microplus TaxID=6941 RepID=A0A9J6E7J4_RHIMP|nr:hypothetical protein HPB51_006758 [Rhipicephalus microplus]
MVLSPEQRSDLLLNRDQIGREEGYHQSTWTIDLVLPAAAVRRGPRSKTASATPRRTVSPFAGGPPRLPSCWITSGAAAQVIVLVDHGQLHCDSCQKNKVVAKVAGVFARYAPYQGHYIVLCGYKLKERKFLFRNPSKSDRLCSVTFETLDRARKRLGTDEDVIFVNTSSQDFSS